MSLHYLNRCNMDKIASHPRNTVTWMPIVEQAAQATQFQNSIPSWVKDSCFRQLEILDTEGPFTAKPITETNNSASPFPVHHGKESSVI